MSQSFCRALIFSISLPAALIAQTDTSKPSPVTSERKPMLKLGANGLPSGQETPEGVAIDLAWVFISKDPKLFRKICIPPFGAGENRKAYEEFLAGVESNMIAEAKRPTPSPNGPKSIFRLYAARHLSQNGPSSYGYAAFNFQDVMFVDVGAILHNGNQVLNRTLVIKNSDGKWYVHPAPNTCPLLSSGLNEESKSTIDFTEAYEVRNQ